MKASKKTKSLGSPAAVKLQRDVYQLPSHDAVAQILPDYRHHVKEAETALQNTTYRELERPAQRREGAQANKPNINHTYQVHHPHKRPPLHGLEDGLNTAEITDFQTKEVERYHAAMSKMAEDIIVLRTQVATLEAENSRLCTDLSLHQDLGRDQLDDTDINVMTKAEVADCIASLKFMLNGETSKAASQRDRIQRLQNELIKSNDREKELIKLQRVYQQEHQEDLQQRQSYLAKIANLEATAKQQEKVIEKMEKELDSKLREGNRRCDVVVLTKHTGKADGKTEELVSALAAENAHLREELDRISMQPAPVIIQQATQTKEEVPPKEKLSLLNKLRKAESRIQTLEAQLEENSRVWGRQKQEMLTKLSEHRHGLVQTSTTVLHNVSAGS